jgi:ATP/maltotriose-dependent transcriptional regulator MalT
MRLEDQQPADPSDASVTEAQLRRWLGLLGRPDQLGAADVAPLLTAHGRMPDSRSPLALGHATAELLLDAIDRLKPSNGGRDEGLPHQVLQICFVEGNKLFQAATKLGLSERQLSRERSRAIRLLLAEIEGAYDRPGEYRGEPVPTIRGFLPRPGSMRKLRKALETHRLVNVHGAPGIGKTSLVAELAAELSTTTSVLWYRFRPGVNVTLEAVLFEIGEFLRAARSPELAEFMNEALPNVEAGLATRLALKGLGARPRLLVFDDYHLVEGDAQIIGFIDEMVTRLPELRVIAVSRHRHLGSSTGTSVEIGSLARSESEALLGKFGIDADQQMVRKLHTWTSGNVHLLKLAASWLRTATEDEVQEGVESLKDLEEVQLFLLDTVTELLDSDDRTILQGASVFRDRFSDAALAHVTRRTAGTIMDASLRLVRAYVATRSRTGDSAFFHHSVRDYIYERLEPEVKARLHEHAAEWYDKTGNTSETNHHRRMAGLDREPVRPRRRR